MVTRPAPNAALIVVAWVIAVITFFYMLPWAVAATRGKSNQLAIGLVNLLLGWSFIGWVVALVMACGAEPTPTVVIQQNHYGSGPYRY
ncbi:superinfection immunity protein [Allobranchiibius sp. CTAmp26]|nr:superinfection immunity protein [Allobranchiibius sp. CTAmp26]